MKRRTLLPALTALMSPWLVQAQGNKPYTWIVPLAAAPTPSPAR
jgi:hypothetical protein